MSCTDALMRSHYHFHAFLFLPLFVIFSRHFAYNISLFTSLLLVMLAHYFCDASSTIELEDRQRSRSCDTCEKRCAPAAPADARLQRFFISGSIDTTPPIFALWGSFIGEGERALKDGGSL